MKNITRKFLFALVAVILTAGMCVTSQAFAIGSLRSRENDVLTAADPNMVYEKTGSAGRNLTVMIYMTGTNLEAGSLGSLGGCATADLTEMVQAGGDQTHMSVILMAGGARSWKNDAIDPEDCAIYEMVGNTFVKRVSKGLDCNMGEAKTLTDFLDYCVSEYPAAHYVFIPWNHGGGPNSGIMTDDYHGGDGLDMIELVSALEASPFSRMKLDCFAFHTCLMGSFEVACLLAPYAEYMIGSEEVMSSGFDLNYGFLAKAGRCGTSREIAECIVVATLEQGRERYGSGYENYSQAMTLALIDLSKIPELTASVNDFFTQLQGGLADGSFVSQSKNRSKVYNYSACEKLYDLVDLREIVTVNSSFAPEAAKKVNDLLSDTVIINRTLNFDENQACGLTIYVPYHSNTYYQARYRDSYYGRFAEKPLFPGAYVNYITAFSNILSNPSGDWSSLGNGTEAPNKANLTVYQLQLSQEQADSLISAETVILQVMTDDPENPCYAVVSRAEAAVEDAVVRGSYVNRGVFIRADDGTLLNEFPLSWEHVNVGSLEYDRLEGKITSGGESCMAQLYCTKTANGTMEIVYAVPFDETTHSYMSPQTLDLSTVDTIAFTVKGLIPDETAGLDLWQTGCEATYTFDPSSSCLAMLDDMVPLDSLYGVFALTDCYLNTHVSIISRGSEDAVVIDCDDKTVRFTECSVHQSGAQLMISVAVENASEGEIAVQIADLKINGTGIETDTWIEGSGPNDGVLPGVKGSTSFAVSCSELGSSDTVSVIELTLRVVDAATNDEITGVPARVTLNLPIGKN